MPSYLEKRESFRSQKQEVYSPINIHAINTAHGFAPCAKICYSLGAQVARFSRSLPFFYLQPWQAFLTSSVQSWVAGGYAQRLLWFQLFMILTDNNLGWRSKIRTAVLWYRLLMDCDVYTDSSILRFSLSVEYNWAGICNLEACSHIVRLQSQVSWRQQMKLC